MTVDDEGEKKRSISSTTPRPVLYVAFGRTETIQSGPRRCTVVTRVKVTRHQEDCDGTFNSPTLQLKIPYEGSGRSCLSEYPPIRYRDRTNRGYRRIVPRAPCQHEESRRKSNPNEGKGVKGSSQAAISAAHRSGFLPFRACIFSITCRDMLFVEPSSLAIKLRKITTEQ